MGVETQNSLSITPVAKRKWKAPPRQMASHSTSSKYAILHKTSKNNTTMKYFVIRVKTYATLSPDYTVADVVDNVEDAIALAGILQRRDNDPRIEYIATTEVSPCTLTAVPAN